MIWTQSFLFSFNKAEKIENIKLWWRFKGLNPSHLVSFSDLEGVSQQDFLFNMSKQLQPMTRIWITIPTVKASRDKWIYKKPCKFFKNPHKNLI